MSGEDSPRGLITHTHTPSPRPPGEGGVVGEVTTPEHAPLDGNNTSEVTQRRPCEYHTRSGRQEKRRDSERVAAGDETGRTIPPELRRLYESSTKTYRYTQMPLYGP